MPRTSTQSIFQVSVAGGVLPHATPTIPTVTTLQETFAVRVRIEGGQGLIEIFGFPVIAQQKSPMNVEST
jgi:hypothetical protein